LYTWLQTNKDGQRNKKLSIAITQPRRVAAISVANRVQKELSVYNKAHLVGYRVRFEENCTPRTRIKYMTDGMLLRDAIIDQNLSQYG
jgi:HrpA-like RNA helicase